MEQIRKILSLPVEGGEEAPASSPLKIKGKSTRKERILLSDSSVPEKKFLRPDISDLKEKNWRPDALILREKDLQPDAYLQLARRVKDVCEKAGILFFAHSFVRETLESGCMNIHLPLPVFLTLMPQEKEGFERIGVSVHTFHEVQMVQNLGVSYVTFSPVFPTQCKPGVPGTGAEALQKVCEYSKIPVYALGGIHPSNVKSCLDAGADGVCMMSEYMEL